MITCCKNAGLFKMVFLHRRMIMKTSVARRGNSGLRRCHHGFISHTLEKFWKSVCPKIKSSLGF